MRKREFIDLVSARTGLSKRDSERTMDALFQALGEVLGAGGRLIVNDFGTFTVRERAARTARNPRTGAAMSVPSATTPVFKPAQALKEKVNQNDAEKGAFQKQ